MHNQRFVAARAAHSALALVLMLFSAAKLPAAEPAASDPAPAPQRAPIPRLNERVRLDGKLDEGVWTRAARLGPFKLNGDSGKGRVSTFVRVFYDAQALYLAWSCEDPDMQATFIQRDSAFWEEEVCEFFVTPDKLDTYFELQWNPLGGIFDAIIHNTLGPDGLSRQFKGDWTYTARGMEHAVRVVGTPGQAGDRDRSWTVEVRIPFSDLQTRPPRPGDVWRASFYRFSRDAGHAVEPLAWSPTHSPSFHQPARFGYLEFR